MALYRIAGYLFEMIFDTSFLKKKSSELLPGFSLFRIDKEEADEKLLLRFETGTPLRNWTLEPQYRFTFEEFDCAFSKDENTYLFRMALPENNIPWLVEIHRESATFRAHSNLNVFMPDYILRYFLWLVFCVAALSRQIVSIHSSVVMHQGKSVLFLGESGTGKSTHSQLWLNHIPNTELLNDDSPFLRVEADGNIQVYGSPWSGKTPCYKNMHTPVTAFVRLSQAPYNRIRRLTGIEAIAALLPSCPLTFAYDKQLSESIYSVLSRALLQAPVYHLECLPDADAALLVYETLKEEKRL